MIQIKRKELDKHFELFQAGEFGSLTLGASLVERFDLLNHKKFSQYIPQFQRLRLMNGAAARQYFFLWVEVIGEDDDIQS